MIPHEAEYKKKNQNLKEKENQYAKELVIQQRACQQKLVCSSRGKSETCEEVLMCAKWVPKPGFNMTDSSVLIQPEHHQENISVVEDNKLHITLLAVYCEWDIKPPPPSPPVFSFPASSSFSLLILCDAMSKEREGLDCVKRAVRLWNRSSSWNSAVYTMTYPWDDLKNIQYQSNYTLKNAGLNTTERWVKYGRTQQ